jgi:hypothetical protein
MSERAQRTADPSDAVERGDDGVRMFHADDPETGLATDVVLAVAEISESDPTELPPLSDVIDADALDRLFGPDHSGDGSDRVSFNYHGYRVTVCRDGEIMLQRRDGTDP